MTANVVKEFGISMVKESVRRERGFIGLVIISHLILF